MAITLCRLPPRHQQVEQIEHWLFSHISMNWRRRPLTSHKAIVHHRHYPHQAERHRRTRHLSPGGDDVTELNLIPTYRVSLDA
jgi:Rhodopirellula transposase DDE domain